MLVWEGRLLPGQGPCLLLACQLAIAFGLWCLAPLLPSWAMSGHEEGQGWWCWLHPCMLLLLVAWRLAWALVFDLGGESFNSNSLVEVDVLALCVVMVVWVGWSL